MQNDEFQLSRFLEAQASTYDDALEEIEDGRKQTHWMWFIFPQLKGIGFSPMSQKFGISGLSEARRYLAHPVLGARLRECTRAILKHSADGAEAVLGEIDAAKLRSCLTLFSQADPAEPLFKMALDRFFSARFDAKTLALLRDAGEAG